ncbi:hypothetical protein RM545_01385 [Zunongwangia sp. F260]|uniref:Uncharacterized protein n=1 Tax=Autumnicola lenta TaxID=3075593 RepID=A0ABU3CGE4_9FLAO|nr:hypothetical protein [Zunongwangia sp. F260]MDT0645328.1 hypothetical protein [Zunongwangia sp. F260]
MEIPLKISVEQLAGVLNNLSASERKALKSLLNNEWYESEEVNHIVSGLLSKSSEQHLQGTVRASEDVIRESKEKYGL